MLGLKSEEALHSTFPQRKSAVRTLADCMKRGGLDRIARKGSVRWVFGFLPILSYQEGQI